MQKKSKTKSQRQGQRRVAKKARKQPVAHKKPCLLPVEEMRFLSLESVGRIASQAWALAQTIEAGFPIAPTPKALLLTPGFPFHHFYAKALGHAAWLEQALNPTHFAFDNPNRTTCRVPSWLSVTLQWLLESYGRLLQLYGWESLCEGESAKELLARKQGEGLTVQGVPSIEQTLVNVLETAAHSLHQTLAQITKAGCPITAKRLDDLRAAVELVGKTAGTDAVQNRLEANETTMRRKVFYFGLRVLEEQGVYAGFTQKASAATKEAVQQFLSSGSR